MTQLGLDGTTCVMAEAEMDLSGWVIVTDGARRYLGKKVDEDEGCMALSPVFALAGGELAQDGNGSVGIGQIFVHPICGFASEKQRLTVVANSEMDVSTFEDTDKRVIVKLVADALRMCTAIRAARAGVQVVGKVPPNGMQGRA